MTPPGRPYRLFEVVGLELEYAVVDRALRPRCLVEPVFRRLHGRPTSDVEVGRVGFSNELAAHVFELKTLDPARRLDRAERHLVAGLNRFAEVLHREHDAQLLPTGMHPFMRPSDTTLWSRAGCRIYRTYDRIFGVQGHGWLNVQSTHVNLPFGTESETMAMHDAVACLLPYLPALAASSAVYDGALGPLVDNRLGFYRANQARIPVITGDVVPEFAESFRAYRGMLKRIYRALDSVPGGAVLQHEWVNSRGAIMRFMRRALEIRILDTQECIRADVAMAVFVRGALRWITDGLRDGTLVRPDHRMLVGDYDAVVRYGRAAAVTASHLRRRNRGAVRARAVLERLLEEAADRIPAPERAYLDIVADRIAHGNLSERIARAIRRRAPREGSRRRAAVRAVYGELAESLMANTTWPG